MDLEEPSVPEPTIWERGEDYLEGIGAKEPAPPELTQPEEGPDWLGKLRGATRPTVKRLGGGGGGSWGARGEEKWNPTNYWSQARRAAGEGLNKFTSFFGNLFK